MHNICTTFRYPDATYFIEAFDNQKFRRSNYGLERGSFNRLVELIKDKPLHSFVTSNALVDDMKYFEQNGITKDANGLIKVERGNQTRYYKQHEDNSLYPVSGDGVYTLSGKKASQLVKNFYIQKNEDSMANFLFMSTNFKFPAQTHAFEAFDDHKFKRKNYGEDSGKFNRKVEVIKDKPVHSFIPTTVLLQDIEHLEQQGITKRNADGIITVKRQNELSGETEFRKYTATR